MAQTGFDVGVARMSRRRAGAPASRPDTVSTLGCRIFGRRGMGRFDQDSKARRRLAMPVRAGLVLSTALLVAGFVGGAEGATAAGAPARFSRTQATVSDPTAGHAYRHGAVPLRTSTSSFGTRTGTHTQTTPRAASAEPGVKGAVTSGGGPVLTGSPKVYLVFWGSQWGTQTTNGQGYDVYSGDPDGLGPDLQALFSGLGTDNEQWSAIVTQYCRGWRQGRRRAPSRPHRITWPTRPATSWPACGRTPRPV